MAGHAGPGDFGRTLREARERRGLSLRQIANATKISMITLEALERNDIARLPGGIFSRAFVRWYALEVGLEPETAIQAFMEQFPNDAVTAGHPTTVQTEDNEAVESDRRMATTFLRLILISLPIAGFVLYFGAAGRRAAARAVAQPAVVVAAAPAAPEPAAPEPAAPEPAAPEPAAPAPADVEPAPTLRAPVTTASAPAAAPGVQADRLTVQLSAAGRCWVSAVVDGQRAVQRIFQPGDEQTLEVHREMVLTLGDAGALTFTINGRPARPLGKSGQVATARLNLANFTDYLSAQ